MAARTSALLLLLLLCDGAVCNSTMEAGTTTTTVLKASTTTAPTPTTSGPANTTKAVTTTTSTATTTTTTSAPPLPPCPGDQKAIRSAKLGECDQVLEFEVAVDSVTAICCARFVSADYIALGVDNVHSEEEMKPCVTATDCGKEEFCGNSVERHNLTTPAKPIKHCYRLPKCHGEVRNGPRMCAAGCGADEYCDKNMAQLNKPDFELKKDAEMCCTAKCPFMAKPLGPTAKTCKTRADCGPDAVCEKFHGSSGVCCTAEKLCPRTGQLPTRIRDEKECDQTSNSIETIDGIKACCPRVVSKKLRETKQIVLEGGMECRTTADCGAGKVCEDSTPLDAAIAVKGTPKNCYEAKCPLSSVLPGGVLTICEKTGDCSAYPDTECQDPAAPPALQGKMKMCCGIDKEYTCPGGQFPMSWNSGGMKPVDCTDGFVVNGGGLELCCPVLVSKTLKAVNWPIAGETDAEIAANTARDCSKCKEDEFCDESVVKRAGLRARGKPMNCYEKPKCHGREMKGVKMCTGHGDCDSDQGELCDSKLDQLAQVHSIMGISGLCCSFDCPLSTTAPSKEQSPISSADGFCQEKKDCGQRECHPMGLNEQYRACCAVDQNYKCPAGQLPTKVKDRFNHKQGEPFDCAAEEFEHTDGGIERCCPKFISHEFFTASYEDGQDGDVVEPMEQEEECTVHTNCTNGGFCGDSMLLRDAKTTRTPTGSHCYAMPKCTGTRIALKDSKGAATCSKSRDCTGKDETCDFELAKRNGGAFQKSGVCCTYECNGKVTEALATGRRTAGGICGCGTFQHSYCEPDLVNDATTLMVCELTPNGGYRRCSYDREKTTCSGEYDGPLRKTHYQLKECTSHGDCQLGEPLEVRSQCYNGTRVANLPSGGFCCRGDFCGDSWLVRKQEKDCQKEEDCKEGELEGFCEGNLIDGTDKSTHCCPKAMIMNDGSVEVQQPFLSSRNCSKLADCLRAGGRRTEFCDPYSKKCMYHVWKPESDHSREGTCSTDSTHCDSKQQHVCMSLDGQTTSCYRHPLDECDELTMCPSGSYCAPREKPASEAEYDGALRKCHPLPSTAVRSETGTLMNCQKDSECGGTELVCDTTDTEAVTKPGFGYCKQKVSRNCRGNPNMSYVNGTPLTCATNSDCAAQEFCDVEAEPAVSPEGRGVCCSRPEKCGGEAILKQPAGLKVCRADGDCSLSDGEVCAMSIAKPLQSLWKTEEGVCCRMRCAARKDGDLEPGQLLLAGAVCAEAGSCQSDEKTLRECQTAPNTTQTRCCEFRRREGLCPLDKTEGLALAGKDNRTIDCSKDPGICPAGTRCLEAGYCCRVAFCSNGGGLELRKQPKCAEETLEKDCGQPRQGLAVCEQGHCCPKSPEDPFVQTRSSCSSVKDCPEARTFCEPKMKKCTRIGKGLETEEECKKTDTTDCRLKSGEQGVCVYADETRQQAMCWKDPFPARQSSSSSVPEKTESGEEESGVGGTTIAIIVVVVVVVVTATVVGGLFIYRRMAKKKRNEAAAREKKSQKSPDAGAKKPSAEKAEEPSGPGEMEATLSALKTSKEHLQPQFLTL